MVEQGRWVSDREYGNQVISPGLFEANLLAKRGELPGVCEVLRRLENALLARLAEEKRRAD